MAGCVKGTSRYPRVTYHAAGKTFDRLLKEKSLADVKKSIRSKLGVHSETVIHLAQLRNNVKVDLEDDDDFEAFCDAAISTSPLEVQVSIIDEANPGLVPTERLSDPKLQSVNVDSTPTVPGTRPLGDTVAASLSTVLAEKRKAAATDPSEPDSQPNAKKTKTGTKDASAASRKTGLDSLPTEVPQHPTSGQRDTQYEAASGPADTSAVDSSGSAPGRDATKGRKSAMANKGTRRVPVEASSGLRASTLAEADLDSGGASDSEAAQSSEKPKGSAAGCSETARVAEPSDPGPSTIPVDADVPKASAAAIKRRQADNKKNSKRLGKQREGPNDAVMSDHGEHHRQLNSASDELMKRLAQRVVAARMHSSTTIIPIIDGDQDSIREMPSDQAIPNHADERNNNSSDRVSNMLPPIDAHSTGETAPFVSATKSLPGTKSRRRKDPPCPVCLAKPLHYRYKCPIVMAGPDSIQKRVNELKTDGSKGHSELIEELETMLLKLSTKRTSQNGADSNVVSSISAHLRRHKSEAQPGLAGAPHGGKMRTKTLTEAHESTSSTPSLGFVVPSASTSDASGSEGVDSSNYMPLAPQVSVNPQDLALQAIIKGPAIPGKIVEVSESDKDNETDVVLEENDEDATFPRYPGTTDCGYTTSSVEGMKTSSGVELVDEHDDANSSHSCFSVAVPVAERSSREGSGGLNRLSAAVDSPRVDSSSGSRAVELLSVMDAGRNVLSLILSPRPNTVHSLLTEVSERISPSPASSPTVCGPNVVQTNGSEDLNPGKKQPSPSIGTQSASSNRDSAAQDAPRKTGGQPHRGDDFTTFTKDGGKDSPPDAEATDLHTSNKTRKAKPTARLKRQRSRRADDSFVESKQENGTLREGSSFTRTLPHLKNTATAAHPTATTATRRRGRPPKSEASKAQKPAISAYTEMAHADNPKEGAQPIKHPNDRLDFVSATATPMPPLPAVTPSTMKFSSSLTRLDDHHSSTPMTSSGKLDKKPQRIVREAPLFLPTSSQVSTPAFKDKSSESDSATKPSLDGFGKDLVEPSIKSRTQAQKHNPQTPYRKLTDIAKQTLFDAQRIWHAASLMSQAGSIQKLVRDGTDRKDDDEEEGDDDTSVSESGEEASQIPASRKAGFGIRQRKGRGLLSYA